MFGLWVIKSVCNIFKIIDLEKLLIKKINKKLVLKKGNYKGRDNWY